VRGLGTIALKCVGVFVMVGTLGLIQTAVLWSFEGPGSSMLDTLLPWAAALAQFLVGLWLVLRSGKLAARWFDDSPMDVQPEPRTVLRLALLVAGVVLVALAVPGLCQAATYGLVESSSGDMPGTMTQVSWDWINWLHGGVYPLVELVVGVLLVAFSERLSRRLWRDAPAPSAGQGLPEGVPQSSVSPDEA
jgi:hypothetical protein